MISCEFHHKDFFPFELEIHYRIKMTFRIFHFKTATIHVITQLNENDWLLSIRQKDQSNSDNVWIVELGWAFFSFET